MCTRKFVRLRLFVITYCDSAFNNYMFSFGALKYQIYHVRSFGERYLYWFHNGVDYFTRKYVKSKPYYRDMKCFDKSRMNYISQFPQETC